MSAYVRDQTVINERRVKEMDAQVAVIREKEAAAATAAAAAVAATIPAETLNVAESLPLTTPTTSTEVSA